MTDIGNIILCQGIKTVSLRLNNFKRPIITAVILNYCGYGVKHYQINPIIRVLWIKCKYMMTDWSILYCFMSRWRKFLLYMVVTIVCKGLRNLGLCSATRLLSRKETFIVSYLQWPGVWVYKVLYDGSCHLVVSFDNLVLIRTYSNPVPDGTTSISMWQLHAW